ncbi:MAG: hypothetical protein FWD86_00195 [Firmicutes bacterium]|nr:hypothetical protein [Bacillota bacterium]
MKKKIITVSLALTMVFAAAVFIGCCPTDKCNPPIFIYICYCPTDKCNPPALEEFKTNAKMELTQLVESLGEDDYLPEFWLLVIDAADAGTIAIGTAETKSAVRIARDEAKAAVRAVESKDEIAQILSRFDLTDPKEIWDGSFDEGQFENIREGAKDVAIRITFKQLKDGVNYPELREQFLGLSNIREFRYTIQRTPDNWSGKYVFRQSALLFLNDNNPTAFTQAIRHLESLDFIKSATPATITFLGIL